MMDIARASLLALYLTGSQAALADDVSYRVALMPAGQAGAPVVLQCQENVRCEGTLALSTDASAQPISGMFLFTPGNVFIKFLAGDKPLLIGAQPFAHLPLGPARTAHVTLAVSEPRSDLAPPGDQPNSLHHRPVTRFPGDMIGDIHLYISPGN